MGKNLRSYGVAWLDDPPSESQNLERNSYEDVRF